MFAKLVGEGYDRPNADNELPLDVNYAKVSEWLVSIASLSDHIHILTDHRRCRRCYFFSTNKLFFFKYLQVDRRLVAQDWTRKLQVIQTKAADAVKELPPGFLDQFKNGKFFYYWPSILPLKKKDKPYSAIVFLPIK